jgi:hypothetical protein
MKGGMAALARSRFYKHAFTWSFWIWNGVRFTSRHGVQGWAGNSGIGAVTARQPDGSLNKVGISCSFPLCTRAFRMDSSLNSLCSKRDDDGFTRSFREVCIYPAQSGGVELRYRPHSMQDLFPDSLSFTENHHGASHPLPFCSLVLDSLRRCCLTRCSHCTSSPTWPRTR